MPLIALSWMRIVPAVVKDVVRISTTPLSASKNANVTTKDGTPALVMISDMIRPTKVVTSKPTPSASGHGHPGSPGRSSRVITTAPTALLYATLRSISAISNTKTIPMAMVAQPAIWSSRFVKFRDVKKVSFSVPKTAAMMMRPMMMGSDPRSPARTLTHHDWTYWVRFCGVASAAGS